MRRTELFLLSGVMLIGCAVDSDQDGLLDGEEKDLGTDPDVPDTDGDLLTDGEEVLEGLDPTNPDTDGDSYWDGWEVMEDTDPKDENDKIYEGGWPYNPDKDKYKDNEWVEAGNYDEGEPLAYFKFEDHFGDMVTSYDFADNDTPVLMDVSAMWCPPCNALSNWVAGNGDMGAGFDSAWPAIPEMVADGEIYWLTVLGQDPSGGPVELHELEQWYESYPDKHVPVMADDGNAALSYVTSGWPTVILLDEDLEMIVGPTGSDHYAALTEAQMMAEDN